jgi:hypothetical protein
MDVVNVILVSVSVKMRWCRCTAWQIVSRCISTPSKPPERNTVELTALPPPPVPAGCNPIIRQSSVPAPPPLTSNYSHRLPTSWPEQSLSRIWRGNEILCRLLPFKCFFILYGETSNTCKFIIIQFNQNCIHEEVKSRLNSGNACYHAVQNLLSSRLLSKSVKIETCCFFVDSSGWG